MVWSLCTFTLWLGDMRLQRGITLIYAKLRNTHCCTKASPWWFFFAMKNGR